MALADLRQSPMMAHLLDAQAQGKDIGHYGRLTVAIVGHYFLDRDELVASSCRGVGSTRGRPRRSCSRSPSTTTTRPSREQILEWQQHQDFPLCPTPDDPDACNLYRDLRFPEAVYEDIEAYREQRFDAGTTEDVARGTT